MLLLLVRTCCCCDRHRAAVANKQRPQQKQRSRSAHPHLCYFRHLRRWSRHSSYRYWWLLLLYYQLPYSPLQTYCVCWSCRHLPPSFGIRTLSLSLSLSICLSPEKMGLQEWKNSVCGQWWVAYRRMFNVFANVSREKERIFFLLRLTMNVMCYGATPCRMAMGKIGMFGSALLYFGLDCNWELLAVGCVQ